MDDDQEPVECPECGGFGVIETFDGTYGTYDCFGPAEEECERCDGTGEIDE